MRHYVGLDVGKGSHWACVLDAEGEVVFSHRVEATEEALEAFCSEIAELGVADERVLGIDLTGGPATLLEAVLLGRGERCATYPERRSTRRERRTPAANRRATPKTLSSSPTS